MSARAGRVVVFTISVVLVLQAQAQSSSRLPTPQNTSSSEGQSTGKLRDVLGNKKFEDNHEITDARLKAEEGSLSRYSLKTSLSYFGPTLANPRAADQPNPDKREGPFETSIGGSISARYRVSSFSAWDMGTGIKAIHPFHGMERFDMNNPYLRYDTVSRWRSLQMRYAAGASVVTIPAFKKLGEFASAQADTSFVKNLGESRYAVSMDVGFNYYFFNRGYQVSDGKASRYGFHLSPGLKYNFTDRLSVSTSVGMSLWNPRQRADPWALWNRMPTQRLGLGYAIRRDIYLAPHLVFYPDHLAADTTTVNVATIISL